VVESGLPPASLDADIPAEDPDHAPSERYSYPQPGPG
jgi:hypothetical protein